MNKTELIGVIHKSKCDMLEELPLEEMTKEQIIKHLKISCCETLKNLI